MAEFWIKMTEKNKNDRIINLHISELINGKLENNNWVSLNYVIQLLINGHEVFTCTQNPERYDWYFKGQQVHAYLHSDHNNLSADNLDNLPTR